MSYAIIQESDSKESRQNNSLVRKNKIFTKGECILQRFRVDNKLPAWGKLLYGTYIFNDLQKSFSMNVISILSGEHFHSLGYNTYMQIYRNKRKCFTEEKVQLLRDRSVWYTKMSVVLLLWKTNMAAVTSCENSLSLQYKSTMFNYATTHYLSMLLLIRDLYQGGQIIDSRFLYS